MFFCCRNTTKPIPYIPCANIVERFITFQIPSHFVHFSRDTIVELIMITAGLSILTRCVATSGGNENGSGVLQFRSSAF